MTIRQQAGTVNAPFAPTAIVGAEKAAIAAMGEGAFYWRAFERAFSGLDSEELRWAPRLGELPLTLANDAWPSFDEEDGVEYLAFSSGADRGLKVPDGSVVLPSTSHAVFVTVRQSGSADGVIWGNRANITVATNGDNIHWEGLITGALSDSDRLTYMLRGQANRIAQPIGDTVRDNTWHQIITLYGHVGSGSINRARLILDDTQIASSDTMPAPLAALNYRELRVGVAGALDSAPTAALGGARINSIAVVPVDFTDGNEAGRFADIQGYLGSLIGL